MRRILFWTHLVAGVAAGVVILIMCVSGALLAFEKQITSWADHGGLRAATRSGQPLPAEEILKLAGVERPMSLTVSADAGEPVQIAVSREQVLYVDPCDGRVLGEGSRGVRAFFASVTNWHRWLAVSGEGRAWGKSVTGASTLLFLLIIFTGPFLWLPRKWSAASLRAITLFRGGLRGRARDWNWHNVAGIWTALPLGVLALTAVIIGYPWASDLLYQITGTQAPPREGRPGAGRGEAPGGRRGGKSPDWSGLETSLVRARQQVPGWKTITVRLMPPGPRLAFTIDRGTGGEPQKKDQLTLDRRTAEVIQWEPFSSNNAGRKLRVLARFLHTGEAGGYTGQLVAGISCLSGALLGFTGLTLALRRFVAWRTRRGRSAEEPVEVPVSATPSTDYENLSYRA